LQLLICIGPFFARKRLDKGIRGLGKDGGESERKTRGEKNKMNEAYELSHPAGERARF